MSNLLNKQDVWNGLTNAIWMIAEADYSTNNRRKVKDLNKGYMPFYGAGKENQRVSVVNYSEIDFEMVKAAYYWPETSYKTKKKREEPNNPNTLILACTNWDMACMEPESFNVGVNTISYENNSFDIHRWDHWYNALTSKVIERDSDLFGGDYYYFQLEWNPTELIWRIGPEKNKLRVVGYMNDKVTSIPNNQMLCVITQEYHHSKWWPNAPFLQENIPFIANDLEGYLYSLEIE